MDVIFRNKVIELKLNCLCNNRKLSLDTAWAAPYISPKYNELLTSSHVGASVLGVMY